MSKIETEGRTAFEEWARSNIPSNFLPWMDTGYSNFKAYKPFMDGFRAGMINRMGDTFVECGCGDKYRSQTYGAGFIHAKGHCPNCDAAYMDMMEDSGK